MRYGSLVIALLFSVVSVSAQETTERILDFQSDITVHADGSMTVRETISVRCAGDQIKRGIYRDFPTLYGSSWLTRSRVPFEVVEVQRDGRPEPYHIESLSNGKRVYIGHKDVILRPGIYTYTLTYKTDRQLGFFADHDELYWNVTGNDWAFEIEKASATVTLPKGVPGGSLKLEGYTGPQGATGKDFTSALNVEGNAVFSTTRPLPPKEGLTIVVSWPKGYVQQPTRTQKMEYFLQDNVGLVVGLFGILVVFTYYLNVWVRVGRDPAKGPVVPLPEPPKGFSPAAVRYLTEMGYDDKCMTATILNMAVKGFLAIKKEGGVYSLAKTSMALSSLTREERKVASALLGKEGAIELKPQNHYRIKKAIESLKTDLRLAFEKHYFATNQQYLLPGLILSAAMLLAAGLFSPGSGDFAGPGRVFALFFICVWLTGWSCGVAMLLWQVYSLWRAVFAGGYQILFTLPGAVFMTLFATPFVAGEGFGLFFFTLVTSVWMIPVLLALVALNLVFHYLLKAPTHTGRKALDEIEGFRRYLNATEQRCFDLRPASEKTPETFEKYLPYALALGIENGWARQFSEVLAGAGAAGATGRPYSPGWYPGHDWNALSAGGFASAFASSLSDAISSSSSAPGSSSGSSGGGSSGGGGGGGGGGGW
jgi:uncharacterized membrane protein YgcG